MQVGQNYSEIGAYPASIVNNSHRNDIMEPGFSKNCAFDLQCTRAVFLPP